VQLGILRMHIIVVIHYSIAGIRRRRPIARRHVQGVQRGVAIFQILGIGKAVCAPVQTRLVVNRGPGRLVLGMGGERGADAKGETMTKGKLEAAKQVLPCLIVGQVGGALGATVAGAGVIVVGFLRARGNIVGDGNGSMTVAKSGTILRKGLDGHGARRRLALRGTAANGGATDGAFGMLLQALFQAFRVQDMKAALDLHQWWRCSI